MLSPATRLFILAVALTSLIWVLRGLGVLTMIPGAIIWLLILLSIATGIWSGIQRTR